MKKKQAAKPQEDARRRVKKALEITGWSPSRLAVEAGLAGTTISRFLNRDVPHTISLTTASKVDNAVKRYLHSLPDAATTIRLIAEYEGAGPLGRIDEDIITVRIRGVVRVGQWSATADWDPDDGQKTFLPRPSNHKSYFGLRVKSPSVNPTYQDGMILVCVPILDYDHNLAEGNHVVVQRRNAGKVEAMVKEFPISSEDGVVVAVVVADYRIHAAVKSPNP